MPRWAKSFEERFWEKVQKGYGCWLWVGARNQNGYGLAYRKVRGENRNLLAHRISYELTFGKIPAGLFICHHCDNPPCVNPKHLFAGTARDNNLDRDRKGRRRPPTFRSPVGKDHPGAKLTEAQVQEIRRLRDLNGWGHRRISMRLNLPRGAVDGVVRRLSWKQLPEVSP